MWNEKRYIDLWSVVHFLFGVLFVFAADYFELTFLAALITLTVLTTIWEVVEHFSVGPTEYFSNRVTDVIFAGLGFLFMYFLLMVNTVSKETYIFTFSFLILIFITLNVKGWLSFQKRIYKK